MNQRYSPSIHILTAALILILAACASAEVVQEPTVEPEQPVSGMVIQPPAEDVILESPVVNLDDFDLVKVDPVSASMLQVVPIREGVFLPPPQRCQPVSIQSTGGMQRIAYRQELQEAQMVVPANNLTAISDLQVLVDEPTGLQYFAKTATFENIYQPELVQRFELKVETAVDPDEIDNFLTQATVCFEVVPYDPQLDPAILESWAGGLPVIQAETLAPMILQPGSSLTLAQLPAEKASPFVTLDPKMTDTLLTAKYTKPGEEPLQAAEPVTLNQEQMSSFIALQEGALSPEVSISEMTLFGLFNDYNLVISLDAIEAPEVPDLESPDASYIVYFTIDPSINQGSVHGFKSKCKKSASAYISVSQGAAEVKLWRDVPSFSMVGTAVAEIGGANPSSRLNGSFSDVATWDVNVRGVGQGQSNYTIYGSWQRGSGSTCR